MSRIELEGTLSFVVALSALSVLNLTACSDDTPKTSSESNWLRCVNDAECAQYPGAVCSLEERICVTSEGDPIPAGGSPDSSATTSPTADGSAETSGATEPSDASDAGVGQDGSSNSDSAPSNADSGLGATTQQLDAGTLVSEDDVTSNVNPDEPTDTTSASPDGTAATQRCSDLAIDTWLSLDGPDVAWPTPGARIYSPDQHPDLAQLTRGETLFVLDQRTSRLFVLDACATSWREQLVPADFPVGTATRVHEEHFVTWQGETEYPSFDPVANTVDLRPVSEFHGAPSSVEWPDLPSEGSRESPSATAWPYTLYFGGGLRTTAAEREDGMPDVLIFGDGQLYDARTTELRQISATGAPSPRIQAKVFPMGGKFMVFGGYAEADDNLPVAESLLTDGAIYDPSTDTWSPVSAANAPEQPAADSLFFTQTAIDHVWTGSHLLVFGSGAPRIYDPSKDEWVTVTGGEALQGDGASIARNRYVEMFANESLVLDLESAMVEVRAVGMTPPPMADDLATLRELGREVWTIDAWVGSRRILWGAAAHWGEGCENPPPDQGCDPLAVSQTIEGGAFVQFED